MTKSNVIYVDFKNKCRIEKLDANTYIAERVQPTKAKLAKKQKSADTISNRIGEVNRLLDLCDPSRDSDVIFNLEAELNDLMTQLHTAI